MDREKYRFSIDLEQQRMNEFARQILGEHIHQEIINACAPGRVKFFGCSSIGYPKNGRGRSAIVRDASGDTRIDPDKIQPINIFKPIEWLLK